MKRLRIILLCYWIALAIVGATMLRCGLLTENDNYHSIAKGMLNGHLAADGFHPFLYPLLVAGPTAIIGDELTAARWVSALAAGVTILAATAQTRVLFGSDRARWVPWLLIPNAVLAGFGVQSLSDVTATALLVLATWGLVVFSKSGSATALAWGAVAAGSAAATRFPAMLMGLVVVVTALGVRASPGVRARRTFAAAVCWAIGYLPHAVLSVAAYGSPFYNRNWQILPLKYVYGGDIQGLEHMPWHSLTEFLLDRSGVVVAGGIRDIGTMLVETLPYVMTGYHVSPVFGAGLSIAAIAALARCLSSVHGGRPMGGFALAYVMIVTVSSVPDARLILPLVPFTAIALAGLIPAGASRLMPLAGLLLAVAWFPHWTMLRASEPLREVTLARSLPRLLGQTPVLGSTHMQMPQRVAFPCFYLPPPSPSITPAGAWARVREAFDLHGCDTVLVGRCTAPWFFDALGQLVPPSDLGIEIVQRDGEVLLLRVSPASIVSEDWLQRADVQPNPFAGGKLTLTIELVPGIVQAGSTVRVGFLVRGPTMEPLFVDLAATAPSRYSCALFPRIASGDYEAVPVLVGGDNSIRRGRPIALSVN